MKAGLIGAVLGLGLAGAAFAQVPSPATPTPATPGPNPGAAATDAITSTAKPAPIAPPEGGVQGRTAPGATPPVGAPPPPPATPRPPTAAAPPQPGAEMADLVQSARAIAKNTRDTVEYVRVQPDMLSQVLAKLDKIEDKLDKVEGAVKAQRRR